MPFFTIRPTRLFTLAACLLAAASLTAQAEQVAFAKLKALQAAPESAGTLVYRGDTFTQRTPAGAPLYRYERRVLATAKGLSASLTDQEVAWVGLTEYQASKWAQTLWTSAKPSTLTPRWAKPSAWRWKWRMGLVPICHPRRSKRLQCCTKQ